MKLRKIVVVLVLTFVFPAGFRAQQTSSVGGTVQDKSGGVVAGAVVKISNGTEWSQTTVTNERGEYLIIGLRPGTYMVMVSAPGFKDLQATSVSLTTGQAARLDATLEPAEVSAKVTVEGQTTSKIETESSQISGTITEKELTKLGLNGRNFTQLIVLAPGVSNQTGQDEARVGVKGSVKYSVNGGRVEYNTFDVDGSDVLNASINRSDSSLVVYPSLDALSDVQVLTSNYGAQYGKSASGSVLVTTKSGTDHFHGDLYYFNRNEAFNARNFFDQTSKAPLYRKHDVGFTLGGPLFVPGHYNKARDKTFFFWSEEFRLERDPEDFNFNSAVPSLAERDGNFSDVCPFVRPGGSVVFNPAEYPDCPATLENGANGLQYRTLAGNQLAKDFTDSRNGAFPYIDPVAKALLGTNVIPLPNSGTGCSSSINSCFNTVISPDTYWREELFRLDHNFSSKLRGSFRYIHDEWDTTVPTPQWPYSGQRNSFPTIQNNFYGPGLSMVARLTHTISNSLVNDLLFSYTTAHITLTNKSGLGAQWQRPDALSAMGSLFNNGFGGKIPGIVVGGTNAAYGGIGFRVDSSYMPWQFANPTYGVRDDASKVIGNHYLQFGTQVVVAQKNEVNPPVGANTGNVAGILTFDNAGGGNAFANFLTGGIRSFQQDSTQRKYYNRYTTVEPYVQDTWRATRRFTLNLGVRLSLFGAFHEKNLNAWNFDPDFYNPALAAQVGFDPALGFLTDRPNSPPDCGPRTSACTPILLNLQRLDPRITNGLVQCGKTITSSSGAFYNNVPASCMEGHLFNPAPRIGFAWDPTGSGKTSIRGGYGIFFEHGTGNEMNTGSLEGSAPLVLDMTASFPFTYKAIGEFGPNKVAFPLNVTAIQKRAVWPYMQQWSLSVQREVGGSLLASLAYVGSKGTHLTAEQQINQLRPVNSASNPFSTGVPLTRSVCQTYIPGVNTFTVGQQSIDKSNPAYVNILAACIGTGVRSPANPQALLFPPDANWLRQAFPGFGQIFLLSNVADSNYHALQSTLRRTKGPLILSLAYTYSHSLDNSSDRSDATFVNAFDLASNKASSNFDQRHLFNLSYIWQLDFRRIGRALVGGSSLLPRTNNAETQNAFPQSGSPGAHAHGGIGSGIFDTLFQGWELSGLTTYQTGTPFTIINGGSSTGLSLLDNAGVANGTGAGSYPDMVADPHLAPTANREVAKSFGPLLGSPAAFVAPRGLTFGNAGRNSFNNPARLNVDMSLLKHFTLGESRSLEFRIEAFNVFNHTQFRLYNPDKGNTASNIVSCYGGANLSAAGGRNSDGTTTDCLTGNSFLHPVDAHRPRTMQFGLKLYF